MSMFTPKTNVSPESKFVSLLQAIAVVVLGVIISILVSQVSIASVTQLSERVGQSFFQMPERHSVSSHMYRQKISTMQTASVLDSVLVWLGLDNQTPHQADLVASECGSTAATTSRVGTNEMQQKYFFMLEPLSGSTTTRFIPVAEIIEGTDKDFRVQQVFSDPVFIELQSSSTVVMKATFEGKATSAVSFSTRQ